MNTTKRFALSAAAVVGLSAPAFAADVVYQEPPAPAPIIESAPVSSWAGPYAGVHLGYGFGGSVETSIPGFNNDIDTSGWLGGVFGGFNAQNGQFVYGAEADVNYSGVDGSNAGQDARARLDGSLRGRLGYAINDDVLLYGTAGVAAERLRVTDTVTNERDTNMMIGYTVGAGTDVKLTEDVFARAEYRYTDYGSENFSLPLAGNPSVDSSNHRVTVGLGIKF